ncbi:MAG: hypothetical protein D6808_05205 [Candidatus Dadabacteria bacterium]|nr:MAG: hypothetical protein D6808_05205 [Candidatus Dadabacteria bacterium]
MCGRDIVTIKGKVIEGSRVASGKAPDNPFPGGTIELQAPKFLQRGLDLTGFYLATINVSIKPYAFKVRDPLYTFKGIRWCDEHPPENFSLSPCSIVVEGSRYNALLYYPHPETKVKHFKDSSTLEIIAPYIEGLCYGKEVEVEIERGVLEIS